MITLYIRPKTAISEINKRLTTEYSAANNIKSHSNRQSVKSAIVSIQQRLKLYSTIPENGLAIFCGDTEEGRTILDLNPPQPITKNFYRCGSKFQTDEIREMLIDNKSFGFLLINGDSYLIAISEGLFSHNYQPTAVKHRILFQEKVDLPNRHNKGGQSSVRFARLRLEHRHHYLKKVSEITNSIFLSREENLKKKITGLIIGGIADLKDELVASDLLDPRLQKKN